MKFAVLCLLLSIFVGAINSTTLNGEEKNLESFTGMWNIIKNSVGYDSDAAILTDGDIYDDYDNYIKAFMKGAKINTTIKNSTDCVDATRDLAKNFTSSINNAISKGLNLDTYLGLTVSLGVAQPMLKLCFNSSLDTYKLTAQHLSQFSDAEVFFEKMGLQVSYSYFAWYRIYYAMEAAIQKKNITQISFLSGQLAYTLFDFDSSLNGTLIFNRDSLVSAPLPNSFLSFIYDLVFNFLDGANVLQSDKIKSCQNNVTNFRDNFDYAISEFKKKTEAGLYNGVYTIADLLGSFNSVNTICIGGVQAIWTSIQSYFIIWTAPLEIFFNVVWNYRKVYKYMNDGIQCTFSLDAKCIGYNYGKLVYQIFSKGAK